MQQWFYFYERSIGCVGVLKDWLIRTVAATLHDGGDTLSLEKLSEHALQVAQCERMAIDAIEGEQKIGYMASRREQLWRLLQMETVEPSLTSPKIASTVAPPSDETPSKTETPVSGTTSKGAKTTRKKRSSSAKSPVPTSDETTSETETQAEEATSKRAKTTRKRRSSSVKSEVPTLEAETNQEPPPKKRQTTKKRQTRKKTQDTADKMPDQTKKGSSSADEGVVDESQREPPSVETTPPQKKRRVGQRKPKRDPVGP